MNKYAKGAEWRKWDLHIHTPNSLVHHYKPKNNDDVWESFIKDLEALSPEFKVLGINDYLFLDGYSKVLEYKQKGRLQNIDLILPVIELRLAKFGGNKQLKRINFHIIFSDEIPCDKIQSQFLNGLSASYKLDPNCNQNWGGVITRDNLLELGKKIIDSIPENERTNFDNPLKEGFNNLNLEFSDIMQVLKNAEQYFKDKYITGIGKTEWEAINWNDNSIAEKKNIINSVDIVFTASESIENFNRGKKKLLESNVNNLLLDCSDAHNNIDSTDKDRIGNCNTWIKADATFEGLKQILIENERISIEQMPEIFERVKKNQTKYISKLEVKPIAEYNGNYGKWFNNIEIPLNHGLIAIIGNKGSGKSAIADIIALCGNYKNQDDFSFLKQDRFRDGKHANNFEATLSWGNIRNLYITKKLSDTSIEAGADIIKYLPQGYFERLTNDFKSLKSFKKEIEDIVFAHLDEDYKVDINSFEDLINKKKESVEHDIYLIKEKLNEINRSIFEKERKLNIAYKNNIESQIKKKNDELSTLKEPLEVENPNNNSEIAKNNKEVNDKITIIKKSISELEMQINDISLKKRNVIIEIDELKEIKQKLKSKEEELKYFFESIKNELKKYDLKMEDILKFEFEYTRFDTILEIKENLLKEYKIKLGDSPYDAEENESLSDLLKKKNSELNEINVKLGEGEKKYQNYLIEKKNLEDSKNEIIGTEKTPNTLKYFKRELEYITKNLSDDLKAEKTKRFLITKEIYEKMEILLKIYRDIKEKIDLIISKNKDLLGQYRINIDASLNIKNDFKNKFFSYVSLNKVGTYYGKENADKQIDDLIKNIDYNDINKVNNLLDNIVDSFFKDKRNDKNVFIDDQVDDVVGLYNYLFSLDFLDYNYELKQGDKNLEQLSPGEKGALLLIFYLLLDKNDIPLIIDQPEDNLDNQSVANFLVPFIKKAKTKRQIILVTHNPNLAVVADAEQIIYVELDKENDNTFKSISGSIENPKINKCIVKVLEGAMPAFNKRKQKYYE
jgi:ABC-type lipoprotein export system ATPase subunit